jgi:hypothetical protein
VVKDGDARKKHSTYQCTACWAKFDHYYDVVPSIFEAMKKAKVPDHCLVTAAPVKT